jgi:hypothetical protein
MLSLEAVFSTLFQTKIRSVSRDFGGRFLAILYGEFCRDTDG